MPGMYPGRAMVLSYDPIWYGLIGLILVAATLPLTVLLLVLWMLIPERMRHYPPLSGVVVIPLVALGTPVAAAWLLFTYPPSIGYGGAAETQSRLSVHNDTRSAVTIHLPSGISPQKATIAPGGVYLARKGKRGCDRVLECLDADVTIVVLDTGHRRIGWFTLLAAEVSHGDGPRLCISDLIQNRRYWEAGLQDRRATSTDPCLVQ